MSKLRLHKKQIQSAMYAFKEEKILDPENGIRIGRAFEDEFIREDWESFMDKL